LKEKQDETMDGFGMCAAWCDACLCIASSRRQARILPPLLHGRQQFKFAVADALKKGPVVLNFYPAAFTPGCTIEAHNFATRWTISRSWGDRDRVSHDSIQTGQFSLTRMPQQVSRLPRYDAKIMKSI